MARLIQRGCTGVDVRAVQDVLNFHLRRAAPLAVDGDFGPRTQARVTEFQRLNGLAADGIVGPQTMGRLFEEEVVALGLRLVPRQPQLGSPAAPSRLSPPRLIPPLTLPPMPLAPLFLLPDTSAGVPALTPAGQTLVFTATTPLRNDPQDPAVATRQVIVRLLEQLPPNFPFRAELIDAVPTPVRKLGPLGLDPVSPMAFGFKWGVKPVFDLKSLGPPPAFAVGATANARYVLKVIDRPGSALPQLGLFGQGDFKATIDWTSQAAQSRPQVDMKGSFFLGVEGRF